MCFLIIEHRYYFSNDKLGHGDGIHFSANGERALVERLSNVMRKVIIEGKE